jgi:hypothetical protein
MMVVDLIPMIESTNRVLPGWANRTMEGLSMGGMQTFLTPDKPGQARLHPRFQRQHRRVGG